MDKIDEQLHQYLKRLNSRLATLENYRIEWEEHWQKIRDVALPHRGKFLAQGEDHNDGKERKQNVYDSTAEKSLRILAAGMQGGLTSPARPWFRLETEDPEMMDRQDIKDYLGYIERKMYAVYSRSNFYTSLHSAYEDLAGFGTSCIFLLNDDKDVVRFKVYSVGEYCAVVTSGGRFPRYFCGFR